MAVRIGEPIFTPNVLSIHCAELVLKGNNRVQFSQALKRQIAERLRIFDLSNRIQLHGARLIIEFDPSAPQAKEALLSLGDIPGIATYFLARLISWREAGWTREHLLTGPVESALLQLAKSYYQPKESFAIRVSRRVKGLEVTSMELEREWGAAVRERSDWAQVDLSRPDRIFRIDLQPEGVFVSGERCRGLGGLPVGSNGSVLSLLSGGIDSPVASIMIAQRGCSVACLHIAANFIEVKNILGTPVAHLATQLARFTGQIHLFVAPFMLFDLATAGLHGKDRLLIFRRFLAQVAERLAKERGYGALVTGDSLNQVASQTLSNLKTMDAAIDLPILRPLIGFSKEEIVRRASVLGTYAVSIQPQKDCCSLVQRHPQTRASLSDVVQSESCISEACPDILGQTLSQTREWVFTFGSEPLCLGSPFDVKPNKEL